MYSDQDDTEAFERYLKKTFSPCGYVQPPFLNVYNSVPWSGPTMVVLGTDEMFDTDDERIRFNGLINMLKVCLK